MKHFVLLALMFSLSSAENYCKIYDKNYLQLICNPPDTKPSYVIKETNVSCGTVELSREKIKFLDIATCKIEDFNLFNNFTWLRLAFFHGINSIRKEAFIGMNQLIHITVSNSNVEVLSSAFSDLPNLQKVDIFSNSIKHLDPLAFKGAHNLKSVLFSDFHTSSLPIGFFRDLNNLEYLNVAESQFENLTSIDFSGLDKLKWLDSNINRIVHLEENSFQMAPNLKYLFLAYNRISTIDLLAFSKLNNLIALVLESNRIPELKKGMLTGLTNLRSLNLRYNRITHIEDDTFSSTLNLKKLDLANNQLTTLTKQSFQGLGNLQFLSLSDNYLSELNIDTFKGLTKLTQLDMRRQFGHLKVIDLNLFPQFINLETKQVIQTYITEDADTFEKNELSWIKSILSLNQRFHGGVGTYQQMLFRSFWSSNSTNEIDFNNLSEDESLIFGNLNLSGNRFESVNVEKCC